MNFTPRPLLALHALTRDYPSLGRLVDDFWTGRGKDLPQWPPYLLLPVGGWYAIASHHLAGGHFLAPEQAGEVARLAAIGTWRYSQGIYRIAPDMLAALVESPITGSIPTDVLHCLPEWCVYIETPGMCWRGEPLHGFWAHLEWDVNDAHEELRLLLDSDGGLLPYPLHLGGDVTVAIDGFLAEARKYGTVSAREDSKIRAETKDLARLLSLVLYLCTDAPEIDDSRLPGSFPSHPKPKRVKGGWRLFPANSPRFWDVGRETGKRLRQAATQAETGRTLRAHLRRGHWHGYWTGPRKGDEPQKFSLHWLPPMIVGGNCPCK